MLAHLSNTLRHVLVLTAALALAVLFVPDASATTADDPSCIEAQAGADDFFHAGAEIITVISSSTDPASRQAAANVVRQLNEFYLDTDVRISTEEGEPTTHAVVVDGDVAVPDQPRSFVVESVETLYLHWTTASTDLVARLDDAQLPTCASAEEDGDENDNAIQDGSVLAYVDEPTIEIESPAIPVGSQSPSMDWHVPALAAGGFVGGIAGVRRRVTRRRHRNKSESGVNLSEPVTVVSSDEPRYPIADLPPQADPPTVLPTVTYPVADLPPTT